MKTAIFVTIDSVKLVLTSMTFVKNAWKTLMTLWMDTANVTLVITSMSPVFRANLVMSLALSDRTVGMEQANIAQCVTKGFIFKLGQTYVFHIARLLSRHMDHLKTHVRQLVISYLA